MVNETNNVPAVGQMGAWFSHLDETKRGLAKLLARENITVEHVVGLKTAMFDLESRTLSLPMWTGITVDQYDLLIGHEVGHAKFSDDLESLHAKDMTPGLHTFINVLEDTRIERLMQAEFPGLRGAFRRGYQDFAARGPLFQLEKPIDQYSFIDRINIHYKIGHCVAVPFSDEERAILPRIDALRTMREAVALARELYGKAKEEKRPQPPASSQPAQPEQGAQGQGQPAEPSASTDEQNQTGDADNGADTGEGADAPKDEQKKSAGSKSAEQGEGEDSTESTKSNEPASSQPSNETGASSQDAGDDETDTDPTSETDTQNAEGLANLKHVSERESSAQPVQMFLGTLTAEQYQSVIVSNATFVADTLSVYRGHADVANVAREWVTRTTAKHAKSVAQMAMEFERKKNAKRLEHARVSRTGRLDLNKLHSYRFREDIFQSVVNLPNGQNHGIVLLIDGSGSMGSVMSDTMEQAFLFGLFAKRVNVPLRAFIFTQDRTSDAAQEAMFAKLPAGQVYPNLCASLVQVLDTTNAKTWKDQLYAYAGFATRYSREAVSGHGWLPYTSLGSTPLHTGMLVCESVIADMKRTLKLEKTTLIVCTDGEDTDSMYYNLTPSESKATRTIYSSGYTVQRISQANWIIRDRQTKAVYTNFTFDAAAASKYGQRSGYARTEGVGFTMLTDMLHRRHNCRVVAIKLQARRSREANVIEMGSEFFLPHAVGEGSKLYTSTQIAAGTKTWNDDGIVVLPASCTNADAAIVVATNTLSVVDADEEFESAIASKVGATTKQVARAFMKANVNASGNRLFINAVMPFIA